MNNVSNINNIPKEYMYDPDFKSKLKTILIGDAIGCEKIYVNIDYVKPGAESVKYHSHSKQEEFYFIMSEKGDIITYPDENVFLIKDKGLVFNIDDSIKGWTSEPNE